MSVISTLMSETRDRPPGTRAVPGGPHFLFWPAIAALTTIWLFAIPLDSAPVLWVSILVILMGGLPHGGYDMAVFMKLYGSDARSLYGFLFIYLGLAATMFALWNVMPLSALIIFLTLSIIHFGDDWAELPDGLLRICAGAAIIAAPAIGQQNDVEYFFVALGGDGAQWIAKLAMVTAPVILLTALTAVGIAWKMGEKQRAAALAASLLILILAPPLVGFALYFTLLHAPRHMKMVNSVLGSKKVWFGISAIALGILSVSMWALLVSMPRTTHIMANGAWAFQLLSVLVVPHLAFSTWVENRLTHHTAD